MHGCEYILALKKLLGNNIITAVSTKHRNRERWGTRLGVILAVAGSAIGLGNFLRFPVQAVGNGGGAFMFFGGTGMLEAAKGGAFNLGFITMPLIFEKIPLGAVFAGLWFFLLFLAGITSSISLIQPSIAFPKRILSRR